MEALDCYGLVVLVYAQEFGIEIPSYSHVGPQDPQEFFDAWEQGKKNLWRRVPDGEEKVGDVVDLLMLGLPHCGVVIGGGIMLHTRLEAGALVDSYRGRFFCKRLKGIFRLK